MKYLENAVIKSINMLNDNVCDIKLHCPRVAKNACPGQFIEIYPDNGVNILSRPISICEADKIIGTVRVVFQLVGAGTKLFATKKIGDTLRILGPCGNGYSIGENSIESSVVLVGGGIGVPPLLYAAKSIIGEKTIILGYRTSPFLADEFIRYGNVFVCTDDGSEGYHGNVVSFMRENNISGDYILSCGPKIMLRYLSEYAVENSIPCQVSMEERMACGIGACVGCAIPIDVNGEVVNKKVCKDGPVFDCKEVIWQ